MEGDPCARSTVATATNVSWALGHFGTARLGDARLNRRLVKLAAMMASDSRKSIPQQSERWADVMAAYRFLSNQRVDPQAIQEPHRQATRQACAGRDVVLDVQDTTDLDFTPRKQVRHLGQIGDGRGRGLLQHTGLAVSTQGKMLGILAQSWHQQVQPPEDETCRQRQERWTEAQIWSDTAKAIGPAPGNCRLIHVGDRHSDVFGFLDTCRTLGHGFIVRAKHDRYVQDDTVHLWEHVQGQRVLGQRRIWVNTQRDRQGRVLRQAGEVSLEVRAAPIKIKPPRHDPRTAAAQDLELWAVEVGESQPPQGAEPIQWMLLTSQKVENLDQAQEVVTWYSYRWVIEEWHRALKEGCRLEASQLDDGADIQRLAAVLSVVAVRLIELRDLAEMAQPATPNTPGLDQAENPLILQALAPAIYILIVARLGKFDPSALTPRQFWQTIARRGGWLGRKNDGRPGWKTVWRGWVDIVMMVKGAELYASGLSPLPKRCV